MGEEKVKLREQALLQSVETLSLENKPELTKEERIKLRQERQAVKKAAKQGVDVVPPKMSKEERLKFKEEKQAAKEERLLLKQERLKEKELKQAARQQKKREREALLSENRNVKKTVLVE